MNTWVGMFSRPLSPGTANGHLKKHPNWFATLLPGGPEALPPAELTTPTYSDDYSPSRVPRGFLLHLELQPMRQGTHTDESGSEYQNRIMCVVEVRATPA